MARELERLRDAVASARTINDVALVLDRIEDWQEAGYPDYEGEDGVAFLPADLPPVPDGYEAAGPWLEGGAPVYDILLGSGQVLRGPTRHPASGMWRPIRTTRPSDDTIPPGYLRDGPWERGGTREAGIGGALSGPVYSSGTGWRCCVRRAAPAPSGFKWVSDGKGFTDLRGSGHLLWASVGMGQAWAWHGGDAQRLQRHRGPFPSLDAAKEWCLSTLFPPSP